MKKLLLLPLAICHISMMGQGINYLNDPALAQLSQWPATKPAVREDHQSMFGNAAPFEQLLKGLYPDGGASYNRPLIFLELGSWLGASALFMARQIPSAIVICVDHWLGSIEINNHPLYAGKIATLYDTFLANCWSYKDRIVPVRMTTLEGMIKIHQLGIQPDLVYVDAAHSYPDVTGDLEAVYALFPNTIICGDDFDWDQIPGWNFPVQRAVNDFAARHGFTVHSGRETNTRFWYLTKEN